MSATAREAVKSAVRVYSRADGRAAVLGYRETAAGLHRVTISGGDGEAAAWACADVEGARARWVVLAKRLRAAGYKELP